MWPRMQFAYTKYNPPQDTEVPLRARKWDKGENLSLKMLAF